MVMMMIMMRMVVMVMLMTMTMVVVAVLCSLTVAGFGMCLISTLLASGALLQMSLVG